MYKFLKSVISYNTVKIIGEVLKKFAVLLIFSQLLSASTYYSKAEPFRSYTIKSNVTGKVITANEKFEGRVSDSTIVTIDSKIDKIELAQLKRKWKIIEDSFKLTRISYENMSEILKIKRENYQRVSKLKTKSQLEKDREFYDLISSENSYLSLREKALSYKIQLQDISLRIEQIEKSIKDKIISGDGLFIEKLLVNRGDFVTMGTPILKAQDLSKAKLTIFLKKEDLKNIESRKIYIDGIETDSKFDKIWQVSDENYISSYRAEIIIKSPTQFSKLLKVELK